MLKNKYNNKNITTTTHLHFFLLTSSSGFLFAHNFWNFLSARTMCVNFLALGLSHCLNRFGRLWLSVMAATARLGQVPVIFCIERNNRISKIINKSKARNTSTAIIKSNLPLYQITLNVKRHKITRETRFVDTQPRQAKQNWRQAFKMAASNVAE